MLTVAIAIDAPTDYGSRAEGVVAAACEEVIGEQRCPIASELAPGTVSAWYASVHPNDRALSSLRIEFHDRTADGVLIEERVLSFSARDTQKSRLASAGSVIAAMAAAREGALAPPPQRRPSAAPAAPPVPPRLPAAADTPGNFSLGLAGVLAPTFGDGPYRVGGLARANWDFARYPFALAELRYATHAGNPAFSWWSLSVGVGSRLGDRQASLMLEFAGEVVFERTVVTASSGGAREQAAQSGWGGRVGVDAVWATSRHSALVFGVDGTVILPAINVTIGEQDAAHLPLASLGLSLGIRFQP